MSFIENIKGTFGAESTERGSLVETVLLIAGFAIVAILVISWVGGAIAGQAANVSNCIAGANGQDINAARTACTNDTVNIKDNITARINSEKGGRF